MPKHDKTEKHGRLCPAADAERFFLITVIVAGLLAFVNYLTADTIAEHTAEAARSAMTQVLAADDYTELPCRTRRPPPA